MTGKPPSAAAARKTWQRVRKEAARAAGLEARECTAREARRQADPRRNMPSRWSGRFAAPLAEKQPQAALNQQHAEKPAGLPAAGAAGPGQSRESGPPALPKALENVRILDRAGNPVDLRQFIRTDGEPEPWDDPSLDRRQHELTSGSRACYATRTTRSPSSPAAP